MKQKCGRKPTHGFTQSPEKRQAYNSYRSQMKRCGDPRDPRYKYSGARGIKVTYSLADFVDWWVLNLKTRTSWHRPTCGRIDHAKDYSFDNIEMQECSENSKERQRRVPGTCPRFPKKKVVLLDSKGNPGIIFESVKSAEKIMRLANVIYVCQGKRPATHGFKFKYYEECGL